MRLVLLLGWIAMLSATLAAQEPLTLEDAVRTALDSHPALEVAAAEQGQAEAGVYIARAGYFPRVSVAETYMRSNNPVFAFSSLLNQRRFTESNFAIDSLNHPDSVQNFQSAVRVEQVLFDAKRTKHAVRAARLRGDLSEQARRLAESDVLLGAARTYFGALVADESASVAKLVRQSVEEDLRRARNLNEAGLATSADVRAVQARLAAVEEQVIRAEADAATARAALNDALGLDLDRAFDLTTGLDSPAPGAPDLGSYLTWALDNRPDLAQAALAGKVAEEERLGAQSDLWPMVVAHGQLQADAQRLVARGGGSWMAGVSLQWDVWKGSEKRSRIAAARYAEQKASAVERRARSGALLQVRSAYGEHQAATERVTAASSAIEQAEESLRIVRNRYEAGLETVTAVLQSETALAEARFRKLAAQYDRRVSRAMLEHAAGRLTADSEALR